MSDALTELRALRQVVNNRRQQTCIITVEDKGEQTSPPAGLDAVRAYDVIILDINRAITRLRAEAATA